MDQKKYNILGLSFLYHDSSAVIIKNNEIIAACQEERFTRIKFDNNFPLNAINECLKIAGLKNINDIDGVAIFEDTNLKYERIANNLITHNFLDIFNNIKKLKKFKNDKMNLHEIFKTYFPEYEKDLIYYKHHLSHAASGFFPSPFDEATIVCFDGIGEYSSTSISKGYKNDIKILKEQIYPNSLGFLYSAFTQFLGFKVDSGEYKLMGLAPYGKPIYVDKIKNNMLALGTNGEVTLNLKFFDFVKEKKMFSNEFSNLFNIPPRKPEYQFTQIHMDIACSIQTVIEEIILKIIKYSKKINNSKNLCLSGGVALNCVANGKILKSNIYENIWIQPASGDAGCSLGAAYLMAYNYFNINYINKNNLDKQKNSYLGPNYSNDFIKDTLDAHNLPYKSINNLSKSSFIANQINNGKIIALFQGKMEFGPRSLGNRSILGDPRRIDMQKKINLATKFRESFRPFAPIIKLDKLSEWFDMNCESPYMLLVSEIIDSKKLNQSLNYNAVGLKKLDIKRSKIPSVTHVDYSCRIQTIKKEDNELIYNILDEFEKITDIPILINTSFNVRGEPIVCTPFDAIKCFLNADIDYLIMEDFLIEKLESNHYLKDEKYVNQFDKD